MTKKQTKNQLLEGLNNEQSTAVTHEAGPLLIVAGAGTGKTTVITKKIAWLIDQKKAEPREILALTFTDKAATEMEERVDRLLPYGYVDVQVSTFHSFCEKVLRDYGLDIGLPADFRLLNQTEQWLMVRQNLDKFDLDYYRPLGNPTKFIHALLSHFSRAKDEEITPEDYLKHAEEQRLNLDSPEFVGSKDEAEQEVKRLLEVAKAYSAYQNLLYKNSALDFGDLIMQALTLFRKRPNVLKRFQDKYKYILVDEFQDTNYAQYVLVKMLAAPQNNLTVVGDDDQSIYKFRGASFSNILKFRQDYPDAASVMLTENYRSKQNILDLSYKFIQNNNPDRLEIQLNLGKKKSLSKKLVSSQKGQGTIAHLCFDDQYKEASGVLDKMRNLMAADASLTYNDFAILVRSHDALAPFIEELDHHQIPYMYFANKGLYRKSIVLDIISYLKLLDNYHESEALYRILNLPVFGLNHSAVVELGHLARKKNWSLYEALKQAAQLSGMDQASLAGTNKLLSFLEKHYQLSKDRSVEQIFVQIIRDLELIKLLNSETAAGLQNAKFLQKLHRKVKDFCASAGDRSVKAFINHLNLELEAGDEGALDFDPDSGPEAVKVMTVHAAKGLEFAHVFVVGLVDKRFPTIERRDQIEIPEKLIKDILPEGDVHLQEERRLLYVAMTRAKEGLFLTRAFDYGGKLTKKPSRFLVEFEMAEEEKSKPTGQTEFRKVDAKVKLPVPRSFSFSQVSTFRKCPLEYKYKYVIGLPSAGTGNMSFGQTIHKTLEKYLQAIKAGRGAQDLFGKSQNGLPAQDLLKKFYQESWIEDWYVDKIEMEKYRKAGLDIIKNFYDECSKNPPHPKYLEEPFSLKIGKYIFAGKIDRADETPGGLRIIDYKTGQSRKIDKVDKEQLLIYQLAAQEYLQEKVAGLEYWFMASGIKMESFLGKQEELAELKAELQAQIEAIVDCITRNNFLNADLKISHDCEFRELENAGKDYLLLLSKEGSEAVQAPL